MINKIRYKRVHLDKSPKKNNYYIISNVNNPSKTACGAINKKNSSYP